MRPIRRIAPPGPIYADDYNAVAAEVARLGNFHVAGGGAGLTQTPGGVLLTLPDNDPGFWARVTFSGDTGSGADCGSGAGVGSGSGDDDCEGALYEFEEVEHRRGGRFEARVGGRSGECYEVNRRHVPDGEVVWMRVGWAKLRCGLVIQEHVFQYEGLYRDECDGGGGSGVGCGDNPSGMHGPVIDVCCEGVAPNRTLRVVYADDLG